MKRFLKIVALVIVGLGLAAFAYGTVLTWQTEAEFPATGEIITVNDARTHVFRAGSSGSPILMIHGAGGNTREFEALLAPHLEDKHRLLIVDRPGHGYSEAIENSHTLSAQAAHMAGILEAEAAGEKAVIVGHSYGTAVALRLALDRPDLVKGIVLLAPATHDWGPGKVAWYNAHASKPVLGHALSYLIPIFGPSQARAQLSQTFHPAPEPEGYYEKVGIDLMFRPATFRANARELVAFREELAEQQKRYAEITAPVVAFSGTADITMDSAIHSAGLKSQVPSIEIIALDDEGHIPHARKRKEVVSAIVRLADSQAIPERTE